MKAWKAYNAKQAEINNSLSPILRSAKSEDMFDYLGFDTLLLSKTTLHLWDRDAKRTLRLDPSQVLKLTVLKTREEARNFIRGDSVDRNTAAFHKR